MIRLARSSTLLTASAAAMILGAAVTGCTGDESAPTRPRTQGVLAPDEKAKDNAFNRETETPKRDLPTSGNEFPGQSRGPAAPSTSTVAAVAAPATNEPTVITADAGNLHPLPYGTFRTPESTFDSPPDASGPIPPLPDKPGPAPMVGSTPVPGTPWVVDHSWGEVRPLDNYPHRAWPDEQTTYHAAVVRHDPVYYFNIQEHIKPLRDDSGWIGGWTSNMLEVPWFYANTAILPVLMVLEPPFVQRTSEQSGLDPIYHNFLPAGGDIIPSPTPGVIRWDYPFLRAEENNESSSTQPATTQTPDIAPVAPTMDTPATTAPLSH